MAVAPSNARLGSRIAFFLTGLGIATWASLVPTVKDNVGANDAEFGLLLLALGIGAIASMPLAAAASARYGARATLMGGGGVMIAILPLVSLPSSDYMLAPLLLAMGAAFGFMEVALNIEGTEAERHYGVPLMSNFHAFFSVGAFAGAAAMTACLSAGLAPAASAFLMSVLMATGLAFALPRLLPAISGESAKFVLPRGTVALLALLVAIAFLVEGAILDWSGLLIIREGLADPRQAGLGFMLFSVAMTLGRFSGDWIAARMGNFAILAGGALLAAGGVVLLLTAPVGQLALAGFLLVGAGLANLVPVLFRLAARTTSMHPNMAIAALSSVASLGVLAGPGTIGFLAHHLGLAAAFWAIAALLGLVILLAWPAAGKTETAAIEAR